MIGPRVIQVCFWCFIWRDQSSLSASLGRKLLNRDRRGKDIYCSGGIALVISCNFVGLRPRSHFVYKPLVIVILPPPTVRVNVIVLYCGLRAPVASELGCSECSISRVLPTLYDTCTLRVWCCLSCFSPFVCSAQTAIEHSHLSIVK